MRSSSAVSVRPGAASVINQRVDLGARHWKLRVMRLLSSIFTPKIFGSSGARELSQWLAEPWGSASTSTVVSPRFANQAARLVLTVVLPEPPLPLITKIRQADNNWMATRGSAWILVLDGGGLFIAYIYSV